MEESEVRASEKQRRARGVGVARVFGSGKSQDFFGPRTWNFRTRRVKGELGFVEPLAPAPVKQSVFGASVEIVKR